MFKSTIKKSNIINNLLYTQTNNKTILNKINLDNNYKNQKTFLLEDSKKRLIPKLNEDRRLYYTKSEINFKHNKNNNAPTSQKKIINSNNDIHSIKREKCLQKLKDMIFSPCDINYMGKELKENGGTYNANNLKYSKNISKIGNLLPNKKDNKKTLVLDLDETLIHSAFEPFKPKDDITLKMKLKEDEIIIHVLKRPYLEEFLNIVTQKYEVVIFTASISDYANPLLDQLDPYKKISYRLFREHCTKSDSGLFIKDLNKLGRNLKDIIIIDNNPVSFTYNKGNGLPILTWHSIQSDNELIKLIPLLSFLANVDDIRPFINKVVNGYYINYKEVNRIISSNNNYSLNNNNKDDDYFNNWLPNSMKKVEKINSANYLANKENTNKENDKNTINDKNQKKNAKRKESFDQLIKYKGLLGSKEEFNFDNYKKSRHTKLFSGFLNDNDEIVNDGNYYYNNGFLTKKSSFLDINERNNRNLNNDDISEKYDSIYNSRLDKKRNHSSKNLIKIIKNVNNENENNLYYNMKKIKKEKDQIKYKDISFTKYNVDYSDNSKLNKTDNNINLNKKNEYTNIIMNNNTNIINNNIYVINDKQTIINNENNNTIEYSNRKVFNDEMNKSLKGGNKSANYFYNKKERSQSAQYKQKQVNHDDELTKLIDNLINYTKTNKKININSNELISISNNTKYLNNQKLTINHNINNLKINNAHFGNDLFSIYNKKINNEKQIVGKKSSLFSEFNNKINNYNMNYYNSYKNSKSNIYVDTGNNLENYSSKSIKKSFLYDDNEKIKKNTNEYNNYKLIKHYTNIGQNKTIKYLSPTSNFKLNLYK